MSDRTGNARFNGFRLQIRGPREFYGGLALVAIAVVAIWLSVPLPGQQGFTFGPGTAPRLFAGLLFLVGAFIAITGLTTDGPPIEAFGFRGPLYVLAAILVFGGTIRGATLDLGIVTLPVPALGLVSSTFLSFMIAISGASEFRLVESVLAAVAMTVFCVGVFVYLLALPFPLWPAFLVG